MRLSNGSRVVIVGGGPAGSFSAIHLLRYAAEASLSLEVIIIEPPTSTSPVRAAAISAPASFRLA